MRISFTFFISLLFPGIITAQDRPTQIFLPLQYLSRQSGKPVARKFTMPAMQSFLLTPLTDSAKTVLPQNALPLNFYADHLGIACKMELKLEKQIKLPLRIRLGSKDQVDYLEGKYNRHR